MPIISQLNDTAFKSIKYGSDQVNGGNSGQPYITTDVNDPNLTNLVLAKGGLGSLLQKAGIIPNISINNILRKDDGFIRGGILGATTAGIVDAVRVGSWILNNPLWIAKQVGLQLSNPRLETPKNISLLTNPGNLLSLSTNGILQPTRIYNLGVNTLLQVPTNAFGVHFYRHGLGPTMDDNQKYEYIARANNEDFFGFNSNRLVGLKSKLNVGDPTPILPPILSSLVSLASNFIPGSVNSILNNILSNNTPIDDYITGPGSVYGIGKTLIKRYQNTTPSNDVLTNFQLISKKANINNTAVAEVSYNISRYLGVTRQVNAAINFNRGIKIIPGIADTLANNGNSAVKYASPSMKKYSELFAAIKTNISQSIPFSDGEKYTATPSKNSPFAEDRRYFQTQDLEIKTGLNRNAPDFRYYGKRTTSDEGSVSTYGSGNKVFERYDSDILTVMFRGVDPFTQNEERWAFSAYINGYRDSFDGSWNDINYVGRSETFYVYSKFKRSVSFGLKIPCFNRTQLFEKHRALGQLASTTAGRYNPNGTNTLGGMLLRLNVGNYLVGEYATLNNLTYSIPDDSSWDITPEARLAMYIEATFNFNIVHQYLPQYQPSRAAGGDNNDVGFFGYLPNSVSGDAEFLKISGRTPTEQNGITSGFSVDLIENSSKAKYIKGTPLSKEYPIPVAGNTSRYIPPVEKTK